MPVSRGRNGRRYTGPRRGYKASRISTRALRKSYLYSIGEGAKQYSLLLALLAQAGGELTVTAGTLEQVGQNLQDLSYVMVPGKESNEFIVRMVEGKTVPTTLQAPEAPNV